MTRYEVTVGNIGTVRHTGNLAQARAVFAEYVRQSQAPFGRAAGEDVTLWADGEPITEYDGNLSKE